ncbi:cytochrome P450 83B1-like [Mercurialis annua]|uniref:cytochrome P450 83B1-like n=1 Tax=Mercurialis annua TaxID=3986 RepID=UPI00215ED660|nr:cytochrome P450 83B1-like [Mercurialis annua]
MPILILFLLLLPIFIFFLFKKHHSSLHLPPGPKADLIFGNLKQLDNSNLPKYLWQLSKQYGDLMSLRLGMKPTLVVSSAKMAQEVLKTHDLEFCSRPRLSGLHKISYNGVDLAFSPYDAYWREMRKISVVHVFNSNRVQSFRDIREDEVRIMLEKISKLSEESKVVNLSELMMSVGSGTICRIAFGKRYEDGGSEAKRFHNLLMELQVMFGSFYFSDYFPYVGYVIDKMSGLLSRLDKVFHAFDDFYQELIDEHLDPNRNLSSDTENILDVLLQLKKDRSFKVQLNFNNVKAVLMNMFVAGTDTSAASVIWCMCFLLKYPTTMKKAQEEVRTLIGKKGFVNEDDIQNLPYLKAVIKEMMRLQPPVPLLIPRETVSKCSVGGYDIGAKTLVYVNALAIGRDPEAWENPLEFDPERFLKNDVDMKGQHYELIPFGAGRRICPGIFMGIANVEIALANLIYKFDWEMPDGMSAQDIHIDDVNPGIVVHKKGDLSLMAKTYV